MDAEIIQAEKIQMTEEQVIKMLHVAFNSEPDKINFKVMIGNLKDNGYIKKSELETLVEEAEEDYRLFTDNFKNIKPDDRNLFIEDMYKTIQAFKTKFPEWNK